MAPPFADQIRLLGPGDEDVVRQLATVGGRGAEDPGDPDGLLADPRALLLVAFAGGEPVGFALAYELPRRHGDRSHLFLYEVEVAESHRRRGIATALLARLGEIASERGIRAGFVLTEADNAPANALYEHAGATSDGVSSVWQFAYTDG